MAYEETLKQNDQTTSYYDSLKKQLEKEKFNSAIQINNAKESALKGTQANLNANGYGSQGFGVSQQIATNNAYANAQNENQSTYWDKLQSISKEESDNLAANWTDNYESFLNSEATSSAYTRDDWAENGSKYGLFTKDQNGAWVIDKNSDAYTNLTAAQQNTLIDKFENFTDDLVAKQASNVDKLISSDGYTNVLDISQFDQLYGLKTNAGTNADGWYSGVKNELNMLKEKINNGSISDGSIITLRNSNYKYGNYTMNLIYRNGKIYVLNAKQGAAAIEQANSSGNINMYRIYGNSFYTETGKYKK